jgi:uncharacterized protein (DUF1810 family)
MDDHSSDHFNLQRFVDAQVSVFDQALAELRAGRKRSHWMWFIFPQIAGLGASSMAHRYAISNIEEAVAYLDHPTLGPRLTLATEAVNQVSASTAGQIFGYPDNLKFCSSMTLFARAAPTERIFEYALQKYFAGQPDAKTNALL